VSIMKILKKNWTRMKKKPILYDKDF